MPGVIYFLIKKNVFYIVEAETCTFENDFNDLNYKNNDQNN